MDNELKPFNSNLYGAIRQVLETARRSAYKAVNFAMVQAYWQIGRRIVEDEQKGEVRAEYGKKVLEELARQLTAEFGKGVDARELRKMRQFYLQFQKWDAVRPELSWTNYRGHRDRDIRPALLGNEIVGNEVALWFRSN